MLWLCPLSIGIFYCSIRFFGYLDPENFLVKGNADNGSIRFGLIVDFFKFVLSEFFKKWLEISTKSLLESGAKNLSTLLFCIDDLLVTERPSEKKLYIDYFEVLNFIVFDLFDCGELITGSLKLLSSLIYPCFVITLSFPENFSRKQDLEL